MTAGEDEIVAWFEKQRTLSPEDFPIGIGDDMAQVRLVGGVSVFITTDMLLDGVHFDLRQASLEQVGYKSMAASLSDCAAMATIPLAAVVAVALPSRFGAADLKQLHTGILRAGDKYHCALVGGDITGWGTDAPFAVCVSMISKQAANRPILRSGARPGDVICVTGALGGSRFGRHLEFEPRVEEALEIAQTATIHAMMDISDGLSSDLNRICKRSRVGAVVDAGKIPISADARRCADPLAAALNDGEDFELLFTLSENDYRRLISQWKRPVPISAVGAITESKGMQIRILDGRVLPLEPGGYDHLRT